MKGIQFAVIACVIAIVIITIGSGNIVAAILVGIVALIVQLYKINWKVRFYITQIRIDNKKVHIEYWDKEERKTMAGDTDDFRFEMKYTLEGLWNPFLVVYFKDESSIRQIENGDWTRKQMDEIIDRWQSL